MQAEHQMLDVAPPAVPVAEPENQREDWNEEQHEVLHVSVASLVHELDLSLCRQGLEAPHPWRVEVVEDELHRPQLVGMDVPRRCWRSLARREEVDAFVCVEP